MHARKLSLLGLMSVGIASGVLAEPPKNVLYYIGDGMGPEQVKAANFYKGAPLSFETLPYQGELTTRSANSSVTDSAAAATALATGVKVNNGVISLEIPGSGDPLVTLLEEAQFLGKSVGLLTTAYLTHATPAGFGAHATSRSDYSKIASDYLNLTRPNVLYGGGGNGLSIPASQTAGYTVVDTTAGFNVLPLSATLQSAQFGTAYMPYKEDYLSSTYPYPTLPEMVAKAIAVLSQNPNGFFLMIEAGRIDHACHSNWIKESIHETLDLSDAVQVGINWASGRTDTLLLVTADHETGGLTVHADNGAGNYPTVTFGSTGHTGANVPAYAIGVNSELISGIMDNTYMPYVCTANLAPSADPTNPSPQDGEIFVRLDTDLSWTPASGAEVHDVYFGSADESLVLLETTSASRITPPILSPNAVYFWQIYSDGVEGPLWSFTTTYTPDLAYNLSPADLAIDVPVDVELSWQVGVRTDSVEVYFGTNPDNLQLVSAQTDNTFQPGVLEEGTEYYWSVDSINTAGRAVGAIESFVTAVAPPPVEATASGETTTKGNLLAGDYSATSTSDNTYEELEEVLNVSNKNGYSTLDHSWIFDVGSSPSAVLYVEAFQSHSYDGDNYVLSYSLDNVVFTDMLIITKEYDTHAPQVYAFPEPLNGTVYVRVQDTDHTRKNQQLDTLFVDHLYILASQGGVIHQYAATAPNPPDGAEGIDTSVVLSWTPGDDAVAHNVWLAFDNDILEPGFETPETLVSSAQTGTSYGGMNLDGQRTYYWRIDEIRANNEVTAGQIWSFTTNPDGNCEPSSLDVVSLVLGTVDGARGTKFGSAMITVQNNCNDLVAGALVSGHFTGDFSESVVGRTDVDGTVVLQTTVSMKKPSFGFEVDSVVK